MGGGFTMVGNMRVQTRLGLALLALGVVALLSLLLAPLELLQPAAVHLPPLAFRSVALINPVILLVVAVAIGTWLAPSVGLDAPLVRALIRGEGAGAVLRQQILPALAVGLVTAFILYGYSVITTPWFAAATKLPDVPMAIATKLLYGGVVEELLTRWGIMTLFIWAGWRLMRRPDPVPSALYLVGAALAALLFAAGHLPLLYLMMPSPPAGLIAAVIIGNSLPGFLFGLLFWRRGLEAAMIAHAAAHLLFTLSGAA